MLIWSFWGAIYIPFFVRLPVTNAWNCHALYTHILKQCWIVGNVSLLTLSFILCKIWLTVLIYHHSGSLECFLAHMSQRLKWGFSGQNLSVVRRCCWRWRGRKLFTISISFPEPLGQFQPNLAQSIVFLGQGDSREHILFQGEIITK